ncbi:MAG: hypothetical protein WDO69_24885 [Pseudomonadota bacterium]
MSRGRTEWVGFVASLLLGAPAASAAEAEVTVRCPELSAEDTAEVEARIRASLLSAGLEPSTVELGCEVDSAQTQVTGNGHQVTVRTDRNVSSVKEALLVSAESALSAWSAQTSPPAATRGTPPAGPAPVPSPARDAQPAPVPVAVPVAPPAYVPDARPTVRSSAASTSLAAGPRAELWRSSGALGPVFGLHQKFASIFVAIQAGYLLSLDGSSQFSAHELQFGAQVGWQPRALSGLRAALGVGLSVLSATPAMGVSAQSGSTSSTLPCLSVELSRPFELGAFALLPAAGARAFSRARSVLVDG